jgi:hypothetical protein
MRLTIIIAALAAAAYGGEVRLAWNAQKGVTDFRVWRGIECLATVVEPSATVTLPAEPCVLTVTARNEAGESAHSAPLDLMVVTLEQSADLKAWTSRKTWHAEKQARGFFRLKLQVEGGQP